MHRVALAVVAVVVLGSAVASADPRPFTFSNDTYPMGKGDFEYEQWVTWRKHTENDTSYDRVDFRHEFEFGLAENIDLGLYLPSWNYEDSQDHSGTQFGSIDIALVTYFSNPVTDFVGVGVYNEVMIGEESLGFESKLLVQKDVRKWIFLYNLVLETEVEGVFGKGDEIEVEGELVNTFGASYAVAPGWLLGAEAVVESAFENWSEYEHTTVYAGPAISFQGHERLWVTVTPMYQLSDVEDEPDFLVRAIIGLQFSGEGSGFRVQVG